MMSDVWRILIIFDELATLVIFIGIYVRQS